jgi:hypothetical protein
MLLVCDWVLFLSDRISGDPALCSLGVTVTDTPEVRKGKAKAVHLLVAIKQ